MAKMINKNALKLRVNIQDFISREAGIRDWKSITNGAQCSCPFSSTGDSNPSFTVYPNGDDPHYHCFHCGADGDVISFVEQYRNLEFYDALKYIAEKEGILDEVSFEEEDLDPQTVMLAESRKKAANAVAKMTALSKEYEGGTIDSLSYDDEMSRCLLVYQYEVEKYFGVVDMPPEVSAEIKSCFVHALPVWLTKDAFYDPSTGFLVPQNGGSFKTPLYTADGTKLCDSFNRIVISAQSKSPAGAYIEFTPQQASGLSKNMINKPRESELDGRFHIDDRSGSNIYLPPPKAVPNPAFTPGMLYVDVNFVRPMFYLKLTQPERFGSALPSVPEFLNKDWFRLSRRVIASFTKQNVICSYKLIITPEKIFLRTQQASVSAFVGKDPNTVDVDKVFEEEAAAKRGLIEDLVYYPSSDPNDPRNQAIIKRAGDISSLVDKQPYCNIRELEAGQQFVNVCEAINAKNLESGKGAVYV